MRFLSVVVPTQNQIKHLPETLDSLLGQTHREFEVLIVDNGSTDGTPELVKQWRNKNDALFPIRVFRQEPRNISTALNRGIAEAESGWVAFLLPGDVWMPDRVKSGRSVVEQSPFLGLLAEQARVIEDGVAVQFRRMFSTATLTEADDAAAFLLKTHPLFALSAMIVQKEAVDAIGGFWPEMSRGEDIDLVLRLALRHKIRHDPTHVADTRPHAKLGVGPDSKLGHTERLILCCRHALAHPEGLRREQIRFLEEQVRQLHLKCATEHSQDGDRQAAREHYRKAWELDKGNLGLLFKSRFG